MRAVLKRIVVSSVFTALILAMIGVGLTQMAGMWLATQSVERTAGGAPVPVLETDLTEGTLRYRIPLTMAGWGVLFVVVSELGVYYWRKRRPLDGTPEAKGLEPDTAEILLNELLRQIESKEASAHIEPGKIPAVSPPSPSLPFSDNSPLQPRDQSA